MDKTQPSSLGKTRKISIFLALVIFCAIVLSAVPAEATHAHSIVVFTDKKTYLGWWVDPVKNGVGYTYIGVDDAPLDVYVYTMVLSDKGTIIKGEEAQLDGYLADYKRLAPGNSLTAHHNEFFGETVFGNKTLTFTDDGSLSGDIAGDGVYVAKVTLDKSKGATLVADHMVMNVTVSYPGMESNTQQVLISQFYCMNGKQSGAGHAQHTAQDGTSANCAVCHRGYEHWFENKSKTFRDDQLDIHVFKVNPPDVPLANQTTPFDANRWNWSDDGGANDKPTFEDQVPGSKYCAFCHEVAGSATYDYGAGGGATRTLSDRPSCNNSNCHTTTEISGTTVPAWTQATMPNVASTITRAAYNITKSEKHAHDNTGVDTVPCASCHRTTHSLELPNRTSNDYTDLANRCLSCHSLFNKHNNNVSCIKCHGNDTHNIRFLQQDLSYNWSTTNIVTCDNCHTNTTFAGSLGLNAPQVPYTNHSGDSDAGQKWGDYWTSDNQQAAVGGSNLIQSSTKNVSSQSVEYGTASPLSGAQTVDASYETLTEGLKSVPPRDDYTYVGSNTTSLGSITNWNNIKNATDGNATANFTEAIPSSRSPAIVNGNFTVDNSSWTETLVQTAGDDVPFDYIVFNTSSPQFNASRAYLKGRSDTGEGNITQTFDITDVDLRRNKNLTFKFRKFASVAATTTHTLNVKLVRPNGTVAYTFSNTTTQPVGTGAWMTQNVNVTPNITIAGTWTLEVYNLIAVPNSAGAEGATDVDGVNITFPTPYSYGLVVENSIAGVPEADNYYLEMNYRTAGDTYDLYLYNGSAWNARAVLNSASFATINYTMQADEYNQGGPVVKILDRTASTTTQGNLSIDYMRIHGWTADTSHQEINLYHNFTGIPKYAASETAEYTLTVKGNKTSGEDMDVYAYDYTLNSYQLVRLNPFSTTIDWVNLSIPYNAISSGGNASIMFTDANGSRYDNVADNFYLDYVAIKADNYKYLPCFYCHALLANHKKRALGNIEWVQNGSTDMNLKNSTNLSGNWCANCHYNGSTAAGKYKYNGSAWSPVPPLITVNNINPSNPNYGSWYNHSGDVASNFTDAKCKECHGTAAITTTKQFPHAVEVGSSGGANCTACHNIGGSAGTGKLVNFTAMNDTNAIHKNLNTGASTSLPAVNKKCWACHGNGSEPGSGHPASYKTPYNCVDCHVQGAGQNLNFTPSNTLLNVTQHYWNGTNITTANATSCYSCHNRTEMMVGINLDPDGAGTGVYSGANGGNNSSSHYGKKRNDMVSMDSTTYCYYCHNTTTNNATFYVSDFNNTIFNHSARASTPLCTTCHNTGRIHNSTLAKPVSNDSYCSTCHGISGTASTKNKTQHKALNCTECHANNTVGTLAGKDIHAVKYLTQGNTYSTSNSSVVNCVTCHQTTTVDSSLTGFTPFKIKTPMRHSDNASNGSVWGSYWTNTTPQTACIYCHSNTTHNTTPLGRTLQWSSNYQKRLSIGSNYSCADCHYKGDSNYSQMNSTFVSAGLATPPEITNGTSWKGFSSNYYNHSLPAYDDTTCKSCHGALLSASANMSEFLHNAATGVNGGANCTACHNIGGSAGAGKLVNFSAINDSNAIHKNLNSGATNSSNATVENKKCWACHGNGTEPGGHPSNYKTPYNCTSCHISGAGQNLNFTPQSILNVTQHYWNGTSVSTANATSCYICHNKSEMMVGLALDPDGSSTVYGGANGGNGSSSHYGKKRNDMAVMANLTYCNYCHNNGTTAFPFINNSNKTIANHSVNYAATNPECKECHASGRIHNSTLYKPAFALPNSTYCLTCHGSGGSATIKNLERHNSTSTTALNCTQCHLNSTKSIHPVRYLQQGGSTWDTSKTNAVNCTTCHQGSGLGVFNTAPMTPKPMNHSTNTYSGALWNNTQPRYWDNISQQASCDYCHGKIALHNNSGLGNITKVKGSNAVRQALANSTWCANCHYSGASNYGGTLFSSEPPEITNATGKVPAKARDNTNFYNHSQDMATGYNDSKCKNCHDNALDAGATSLNFSHNVAQGGGGANCTSCHYIGGSVQNINITALNDANAIHKDLNKGATASDNGFNDSKKCWACHSNGQEPSGHPTRYKTPYNCTDCHVQGGGQNFNYTPNNTILNVTQHYWNGNSVRTPNATSCYACHNTSGMITPAYDPDGASNNVYSGANGGNSSVSHYGKKRGDMAVQQNTTPYCDNCHNGASAFPFMDSANRTIANHSANYPATNPTCKDCHSGGRIHNSTLYKTTLTLPNATYCTNCHGIGGSASIKNLERHNNTGTSCTQCHLNASDSIHPVRYLQQDNTWATTKVSAVNCTSCHQGSGMSGFGSAPRVPLLNHSTNTYSGALWNGTQQKFWENTSQQFSCNYCHGNSALHNLSGLGNITKMKGNNTVRQGFSNGYWCANCHYNTTSQGNYSYKGNFFDPEPPEVLNKSGKVPATARDSTQFYNHSNDIASSYDDAKCKTCHDNALGAGATSLNFTHSLSFSSGGANCTNCHGLSGNLADGKRINHTAMNSSLGIHKDLNKDSSTSDANYSESKKCWACHGNGQEPTKHPDNYKTPYNCVDCHTQVAGQNFNYTPNNTVLNVTQHYWNGTSIGTANATSCYVCHNKSEMMAGLTLDPDGASSNIYSGANGGNLSVSHYGKKRSDMAAMANLTYCNYCHNNQSGVFPFISATNNKTIANHSLNYAATNPSCSDCHASGRLHNSTLYKPAFDMSNVTYCLSCHGNNGSGGTNYTGAVTGYREKHNNSVCTGCHINSTRSIHPVRYLQQNNTWGNTNNTAVNCTSCHQGAGMPNFSAAFIVETPVMHSNNTYSGALWNGSQQPRYWDNTSQLSSCYYCHGKAALHNASRLGNSGLVQGGNSLNQSLTGGYWCANCHYNGSAPSGNYNYKGNLLSPIPPEVFNLTGLVPANSSDNTPFQNHSTNIAGDWSDARCKTCHGKELPSNTTSATFLHKLNQSQPDAGGPDCLNCHASTAPVGSDKPPLNRRINASAFTNYSVHKDLNKNAINSTPLSDNRSKSCWACHSDGTQPIKHPANYLNPRPCEYCHVNNNFNATLVYKHYSGAVFAGSRAYNNSDPNRNCVACHNNSVVANLNLTYGTYDAIKLKNATASHYAVNRTLGENLYPIGAVTEALPNTRNTTGSYGCNQCHAVGGSGGPYGSNYGNARGIPTTHNSMGAAAVSCQKACHNSNPSVNITLHAPVMGINVGTSACYSAGCHTAPSTGGRTRR